MQIEGQLAGWRRPVKIHAHLTGSGSGYIREGVANGYRPCQRFLMDLECPFSDFFVLIQAQVAGYRITDQRPGSIHDLRLPHRILRGSRQELLGKRFG